jgi:hypothetical protein
MSRAAAQQAPAFEAAGGSAQQQQLPRPAVHPCVAAEGQQLLVEMAGTGPGAAGRQQQDQQQQQGPTEPARAAAEQQQQQLQQQTQLVAQHYPEEISRLQELRQQLEQQQQEEQPQQSVRPVLQPIGSFKRQQQVELHAHDLLLSSHLRGDMECFQGLGVLPDKLYDWQVGAGCSLSYGVKGGDLLQGDTSTAGRRS